MPAAETIRPDWLTETPVRRLMEALKAQSGGAKFVGGCVRNAVLGVPTTDLDIATIYPPEESMRLLEAAGFAVKPTGLAHGTVTAIHQGRHFEVTTLRRDVETDGRHAVVAYTDDWAEDAARRDFTMNALYMDLDGAVSDPMDGLRDARAGRVRFVGDPRERIAEDALRILRFFRFYAQYGRQALDPTGLDACRAGASLQARLSGERVRSELLKLLAAPGAGPAARAMTDAGILSPLFSETPDIAALERLIALEDEGPAGRADPLRRLAVFLRPRADGALERLRFSNADRDRLTAMMENRLQVSAPPHALRAWLYRLGPERFTDAVLVTGAIEELAATEVSGALDVVGTWSAPRFPMRGADLIKLGLAPGRRVGRILAEIEEKWIADGMRGDRARCLAWARQAIDIEGDET